MELEELRLTGKLWPCFSMESPAAMAPRGVSDSLHVCFPRSALVSNILPSVPNSHLKPPDFEDLPMWAISGCPNFVDW